MRRALLAVLLLGSGTAHSDATFELPLCVHVAPEVETSELERWVVETNAFFAPAGVQFRIAERRPLRERVLENNRDRHRLKRYLRERRINVFVVDEIHDPWPSSATRRAAARVGRTPSGRLGGAHIPASGHRPGTYVIAIQQSMPLVLAHELGHVLGAPHHPDPTNVMSYGAHRDHFDEAQLTLFRARARRLIISGGLSLDLPPRGVNPRGSPLQ
ncbi:MAG: hypothetical protein AAGE52_21390 [Myxococcota bacterium]